MTRARRIHRGERTQSQVRGGKVEAVVTKVRLVDLETGETVEAVSGPAIEAPATGEPREGAEGAEVAEVPLGRTGELIYDGDEVVGELVAEYERMCKSCEANEADGHVVVAPTGTAHLTNDNLVTLCGRECAGWHVALNE